MDFSQIVNSTISDFQLLLDSISEKLAVGPLSDQDFILLSKGYGKINWDYIITNNYTTDSDSFDFCFKLKEINDRSAVLLGAFISSYKNENLEIYAIENFNLNENLKGKMLLYSLFASFLFMKKINGKNIILVDVDKCDYRLRDYYSQFGFYPYNTRDLIISLENLEKYLQTYLNHKE